MIEATLGRAEPVAWYRVIAPAYAGTPLSGMGAARRGGRFNRRAGRRSAWRLERQRSALRQHARGLLGALEF